MRVISGRFKGRKLVSFSSSHIRPTTDRVKESLFNILADRIPSARVLDLFAGTGNLGIEALSRGCDSVTFVESHKGSLKIIRENLNLLDIKSGYEIVPKDVFRFLKQPTSKPYEVIFIDPPFTEKLADSVMTAVAASSVFVPGGIVAIESGTKEPILDQYPPLVLVNRRAYGDKTLSVFACPE